MTWAQNSEAAKKENEVLAAEGVRMLRFHGSSEAEKRAESAVYKICVAGHSNLSPHFFTFYIYLSNILLKELYNIMLYI